MAQFVSQTFVKGDRVTLMTTGGAVVVTGVVESISLLYTTIRSDLFMPISIPNKARWQGDTAHVQAGCSNRSIYRAAKDAAVL